MAKEEQLSCLRSGRTENPGQIKIGGKVQSGFGFGNFTATCSVRWDTCRVGRRESGLRLGRDTAGQCWTLEGLGSVKPVGTLVEAWQ